MPNTVMKRYCIEGGSIMAVIAAEERAQTRVLMAHTRKPERDRAVLRAFLRALGVAWTDAELVAWYGARCTGLDALVLVDACPGVLAPPALGTGVAALPRQGWR